MNQEIGGKAKFDLARAAIEEALAKVPDGTPVGLRCYGHRVGPADKRADTDTELVAPIGPLDRKAFLAGLASLRAKGKTPMAYSLEQAAAGEVAAHREGGDLTVILLTDGRETDKTRKPSQAAQTLVAAARGSPVTIHVVGFDLKDDQKAHEEMRAIAAAGQGRYFAANDGPALALALERAAGSAPAAYALADAEGKEVARGPVGDKRPLAAGRYRVTLVDDAGTGALESREIWIRPGETTRVTFTPARARQGR